MKKLTLGLIITVMCSFGAFAASEAESSVFDGAIRPISNPVYSDSADIGTSVHPIYIYNSLPSHVNTELGTLPVGGNYQVYALQLEIAIDETLSFIAVKDGYIDFSADETLSSSQSGMADLAAGLKWVFHKDEDAGLLVSARAVVELATGDDEVWQGNGDGNIAPAVNVLKFVGHTQIAGTVGYIQPFDTGAESSEFYTSWHVSFPLTDTIFPLVEVNYFRVVSEGDGDSQFTAHVDGGVPSVAQFEGGDLVNLGAANANKNRDFVTMAAGARVRATDTIDFGAAYEVPLTNDKNGLMDHRFTFDAVIRF